MNRITTTKFSQSFYVSVSFLYLLVSFLSPLPSSHPSLPHLIDHPLFRSPLRSFPPSLSLSLFTQMVISPFHLITSLSFLFPSISPPFTLRLFPLPFLLFIFVPLPPSILLSLLSPSGCLPSPLRPGAAMPRPSAHLMRSCLIQYSGDSA